MKKILIPLLCAALVHTSFVRAEDAITMGNDESNAVYKMDAGCGCEDGIFTATSASMVGWGLGLAAAIALLAGLLHQSKGSTSHTSSTQ